jgi:hypothetical protein
MTLRRASFKTPRGDKERVFRIHVNNHHVEDITMLPKEVLKDVFKKLESKVGVKLESSIYSLRTADQETVGLSVTIKNLSHIDELWVHPPVLTISNTTVTDAGDSASVKKEDTSGAAFGVSLRKMKRAKETGLPYVLQKCFDYLGKERSLRTIGLFRLNGNKKEIQRLKQKFDEYEAGNEQEVEFANTIDPNVVTGVVKAFFAELPEPLLDPYQRFADIGGLTDEQTRIKKLKDAVESLPSAHRDVLRYLIEFLVKLIMYTNKNKITVFNMSIVFGPLLLRSGPYGQETIQEEGTRGHTLGDKIKSIYIGTIATMIDNYLQIFGLDAAEIAEPQPTEPQPGSGGTLQDVLSKIGGEGAKSTIEDKNLNKLSSILSSVAKASTDELQPPSQARRPDASDSEHWNEMQESWMKFVEKWKAKYRDEVEARKVDQEKHKIEKEELTKKLDELKLELAEKDRQVADNAIKMQSADHNLIMEKQKLQLELEDKDAEIRDLKRKHEEEVRELKRQYLLAMKNAGDTSTSLPITENQNNNRSNVMSRRFDERKSVAFDAKTESDIHQPSVAPIRDTTPAPQQSPRQQQQQQPSQKPIIVDEDANTPKHICTKCSKEIVEEWVEANGSEYHKTCFACFNCATPIAGPYANRNGNFWCKSCLEDQAKQGKSRIINPMEQNRQAVLDGLACAACFNPIEKGSTDKLKALGKTYHKKCFSCRKCGGEFVNMKFFNLDNEPVCASCKKKG